MTSSKKIKEYSRVKKSSNLPMIFDMEIETKMLILGESILFRFELMPIWKTTKQDQNNLKLYVYRQNTIYSEKSINMYIIRSINF